MIFSFRWLPKPASLVRFDIAGKRNYVAKYENKNSLQNLYRKTKREFSTSKIVPPLDLSRNPPLNKSSITYLIW